MEEDVNESQTQQLVSSTPLDAISKARSQALHFYSTANPLKQARLLRYKRILLARCTGRLPTRALIKVICHICGISNLSGPIPLIGRVFGHPAARATVLEVCGKDFSKKIRHYEFRSLVIKREAKRMDKEAQEKWFWAEWAHYVRRLSPMMPGESPEQHTKRLARVYGVKGQINNRLHIQRPLNAEVLHSTVRQACSVIRRQIVRFI